MRNRTFLLLAFLLVFAWRSAAFANFLTYEGLRFSALPELQNNGYFGYNYMRFLVSNGSERVRNLRLTIKADYSRDLEKVSRSFAIQPGETREESLVFPISDFSSPGVSVTVDGVEVNELITRYFRTYKNYYANPQALVDSKLSRTEFDRVFGGTGPMSSLKLDFKQFNGTSSQLHRNWLGYSQFSLLLYYGATVTDMPDEVRRAIFDYVRAGGSLVLAGRTDLPSDFQEIQGTADRDWQSYEGGFGSVTVFPANIFRDKKRPAIDTFDLRDPDLPDFVADSSLSEFWLRFDPSDMPIFDFFANPSIMSKSPIEFSDDESEKVSARWLMLIVYLFAFIIGPVNLYVLYRTGKRMFVFLTVPVVSIACCVFIYSYYLIFESSTLLVRRQTLTLLDERESRAVVLGNYAVFSARRRPEGLRFDMNTEVYSISRGDYRSVDAGKSIVLDEEQHLTDGWVKPKVPRYLHLRSIQTRRERLVVSLENGQMTLTNGLGANIDKIHLMTPSGRVFAATDVAAGDAVIMNELSSFRIGSKALAPAKIFREGWYHKISDLSKEYQMNYLRPGTYVASLQKSPFFRQSLENEAQVVEEACVIGILKENPEK